MSKSKVFTVRNSAVFALTVVLSAVLLLVVCGDDKDPVTPGACDGMTSAAPGSACCQANPSFNGCQGGGGDKGPFPGAGVMSCNWQVEDPTGGCWPIMTAQEWEDCNHPVQPSECGPCESDPRNAGITAWAPGMGCTWDGTGGTGLCTTLDQVSFDDCRCFGLIQRTGCPAVDLGFTPVPHPIADPDAAAGSVECHHPERGLLSCEYETGCWSINNGYDASTFGKPCEQLVQDCHRDGRLFTGAQQTEANGWGANQTCAGINGTPVPVP